MELWVNKRNGNPPISPLDATWMRHGCDMGAAARLQIRALQLHQPHPATARGRLDRHDTDMVRINSVIMFKS